MKQALLINQLPNKLNYFEEQLFQDGYQLIAGVDEAGRGCLAGPVVAASVILPQKFNPSGLNDSKKLTAKQRDKFYDLIVAQALAWSVIRIEPSQIDEINIFQASMLAMQKAINSLKPIPNFILVDGPHLIETRIPQKALKKGDARSNSIAAASILAKVSRDRIMQEYAQKYPNFSFAIHKGYGTAKHLSELDEFGITPIHRQSFAPVKAKCT
ncbi:MAG: ribonuclease HII [Pseudomonadota bacterium]